MKKQKKQMLVLLIVCLICVGGFLFLQNTDLEKKEEYSSGENYKLEVFDVSKVKELIVAGENELHFVKEGEVWHAAGQESLTLDQSTVNSLATNLGKIYTDTKIGIVEDEGEFGLDHPAIVITIVLDDGSEAVVRTGLYNDIAYGYYIHVNDDKNIYLAHAYVIGSCKKGLQEFEAAEATE